MGEGMRWTAVLLALGLALAVSAEAAAPPSSPWQITLSTGKAQYLVQEPVQLKIVWRNTSSTAQTLIPVRPLAVLVSKDGNKANKYRLFQTREELTADMAGERLLVQPGKQAARFFWIALGVTEKSRSLEFLFPSPGQYTITLPEGPRAQASFTVVRPRNETDRGAAALLTPPAVQFVLGERPGREARSNLEEICRKYHDSA